MTKVLGQEIVLELNKNWQRLKWRTVQDAIICLSVDTTGIPNALVVPLGPDGIEGHPVSLDEWMELPVRPGELAIQTKNKAIRCPLAIICRSYDEMPLKEPQLTRNGVYDRDGLTDQYTGEKLARADASLDHVIPKDVWRKRGLKGSPDRWDNIVTCKKQRNWVKGNKTNRQAGMKLLKKPKAPPAVPACFKIKEPRHAWQSPLF